MSRRVLALALVLVTGCAQSVVSTVAPPDGDRDASITRPSDAGTSNPDAGAPLPSDASFPSSDASRPSSDASLPGPPDASVSGDAGGPPVGPCMTRFQEDIQVPVPGGQARFEGVRALAFDGARRLYVLSRSGPPNYTGWVTVLDSAPTHGLARTFGRTEIHAAQDMIVDPTGSVQVLDWDPDGTVDPVVHAYDAQGNFIRTWSANGGGNCDEAWSLARDDQGRIYEGGLVVFRYDAMTAFLDSIGRFGGAPGQIGLARGMAYDPRGYLWVADLVHNTVHQYDIETKSHVIEIGGRGVGPGLFDGTAASDWRWGPTKIAPDGNGAIYANDPFASRIQKLSRQGTFLGEFSFGNSTEIGPIAVEPETGAIYVGRGTGVAVVCPL